MVIGDLVVGVSYALGVVFLKVANNFALLGVPSFFQMPVVGGFVASYFWRSLTPTLGATCFHTLWMSLIRFDRGRHRLSRRGDLLDNPVSSFLRVSFGGRLGRSCIIQDSPDTFAGEFFAVADFGHPRRAAYAR
jgi:hypothetical protein